MHWQFESMQLKENGGCIILCVRESEVGCKELTIGQQTGETVAHTSRQGVHMNPVLGRMQPDRKVAHPNMTAQDCNVSKCDRPHKACDARMVIIRRATQLTICLHSSILAAAAAVSCSRKQLSAQVRQLHS